MLINDKAFNNLVLQWIILLCLAIEIFLTFTCENDYSLIIVWNIYTTVLNILLIANLNGKLKIQYSIVLFARTLTLLVNILKMILIF